MWKFARHTCRELEAIVHQVICLGNNFCDLYMCDSYLLFISGALDCVFWFLSIVVRLPREVGKWKPRKLRQSRNSVVENWNCEWLRMVADSMSATTPRSNREATPYKQLLHRQHRDPYDRNWKTPLSRLRKEREIEKRQPKEIWEFSIFLHVQLSSQFVIKLCFRTTTHRSIVNYSSTSFFQNSARNT